MATNQPGAAGKFTGKIGQVVLSPWKRLHIARSVPSKSYIKPSSAQLEQRLRLGMISSFLAMLREAISIGFPSYKKNMSNSNFVLQNCINNAVTGTYPNLTLDYSQIQISKGDLDQVYNPRISIIGGTREIEVTWQNPINLKLGVEEHDQLQIFLLNDRGYDVCKQLLIDVALRSEEEVTIKCSSEISLLHVWIFLISSDKKRASVSRYLNIGALQNHPNTG